MKIQIEVPDQFFICGLEETSKGWRVYLKERKRDGTGQLLGAVGLTPQEATDRCAAALRKRLEALAVPQPHGLNIKLDLSRLGLNTLEK